MLIDLVLGNIAAFDGLLECVAEEDIVRLLHIESGMRSFDGRVCTAPVGENEPLKIRNPSSAHL